MQPSINVFETMWYLLRIELKSLLIILFVLLQMIISVLSLLEWIDWHLPLIFDIIKQIFSVKWVFHSPDTLRLSIILPKYDLTFSRNCSIYVFCFTFIFNVFIIKHTINFLLFVMVYCVFFNISLRPLYKLLHSYTFRCFLQVLNFS